MAMKFFLDTILLLYIYGFEGYLSRYKINEMVNNFRIAVNSSDFKKSVLILLKITCNICDWILENRPKCHTGPIPFYWPS